MSDMNVFELYRSAIFHGEIPPSYLLEDIKNKLGSQLSEEFIQKVNDETDEFNKLVDEAVHLAKNGYPENCPEMGKLLEKSKELNVDCPEYLLEHFRDVKVDEMIKVTPSWDKAWKDPKRNDGPVIPRTRGECMYQYCYYTLNYNRNDIEDKLKRIKREYREFGGKVNDFQKDLAIAKDWLKSAEEIKNIILQLHELPIPESIIKASIHIGGPLIAILEKQKANLEKINNRSIALKRHVVRIKPPQMLYRSTFNKNSSRKTPTKELLSEQIHPNDICRLSPAKRWKLYIDESYVSAKGDDSDTPFKDKGNGIVAGILFDADKPLKEQKFHHTAESTTEEELLYEDSLIEYILDSYCGVLALPTSACIAPQGWLSTIGKFIDLVLRILPLDEKCKLEVYIENRDIYNVNKDFRLLEDVCKFNLMQTLPERANLIDLKISAFGKSDPYNAYPDLIAHTCRMRHSNNVVKSRFITTLWDGTCLLSYEAHVLQQVIDNLYKGENITPKQWGELLNRSNNRLNNFVDAILQTIRAEAKGNITLWKTYLNHIISHIESKSINFPLLVKQLNWLYKFSPAKCDIPLKLKFLWFTADLARMNHSGHISPDEKIKENFMNLSKRLFEEDAPLVCYATLHLAVSLTNEYKFLEAKEFLEPWSLLKPEIMGLQYHARVLSSMGQYEAFMGRNEEAIKMFSAAIEEFKRLSDPDTAALEISQTSAYLLISMLDSKEFDRASFEKEASSYFGVNIIEAIKKLGASNLDCDKYKHHILLRYLCSEYSTQEQRDAYLEMERMWEIGEGHPWELIEFYRAMLLTNPIKSMEHLINGYNIALEGSGVLSVIAAVILGAILHQNPERKDEYINLVDKCAIDIPALGERVDILKSYNINEDTPLDLAKKVLPFNFR